MMKKRIFMFLLTAMLLIGALGTVAAAADGGTWGGIDWTLDDEGTLTIAPTAGTPTQLANKRTGFEFEVGEWPEAVRYNSSGEGAAIEGWPYGMGAIKIKRLVIEEGVTSIGSFAFNGMYALDLSEFGGEVVIPSTVTYIGQEAFQGAPMSKLTFAEGGTEALTIAQGALKNLIIEEIEFPADRPAIYLKAWALNNCDNLKHITFPANVASIGGTNSVDYLYFSNNHNSGNHSQLTYYNDNLEAVTFGSEEVKELFFTTWGNPITTVGEKGNHQTAPTIASVGLTYCTSLETAVELAQPGDTVVLLKETTIGTDTVIVIPEGVILDTNEKTVTNNGTIVSVDTSVRIKMAAITYELNGGSFDGNDINAYAAGDTEFTLPTPVKTGYTFKGWSGTGLTGDANTTVTVPVDSDGTYEFTANWTINSYTVTYTDGIDGEVIFDDQVFTVDFGSATPAFNGTPGRDGYTFMGWTPEVAATVTGNAAYTAVFEEIPVEEEEEPIPTLTWMIVYMRLFKTYDITADASEGGTITTNDAAPRYNEDITYTITPDDGYMIADVLVDGKSVGAVSEYTFTDVRKKHSIEAVFAAEIAE